VHLSYGLSVILGFIGVKLIMHAMHEQGAGGIEIGTGTSLLVIVGVLAATVIASLRHRRHAPRSEPEPERELALRR
jgi:tellurite resistance protein TerC